MFLLIDFAKTGALVENKPKKTQRFEISSFDKTQLAYLFEFFLAKDNQKMPHEKTLLPKKYSKTFFSEFLKFLFEWIFSR